MKTTPFIAIGAAVCMPPLLHADTVDDYGDDANPDTPFVADQFNAAPPPAIIDPGTGRFLRVINAVNSQVNTVSYEQSDVGTFGTITASFDFRASNDTNGADGVSLSLIPTATYGTAGTGITYGTGGAPVAEEPNVADTFAIAFDLHANINEISGHWNGATQVLRNPDPATTVNLNDGVWHGALLEITQVGNGSNAVVTVTPDSLGVPGTPFEFWSNVMPGMLPFDNRVEIAGRTGGLNTDFDIDNLNVSYADTFDVNTLPVVTPPGLFQDFDSLGCTGYFGTLHNGSVAGINRPGPVLVPGDGGSTGAFLRLINEVNSNKNSIAFDRAVDAGVTNLPQTLAFDFRITNNTGAPADGFGVYFLPTTAYGVRGPGNGAPAFEQVGLAGGLHVGFDLWPGATAGATDNDLVLTADASELARINVDPGMVDFDAGVFHRGEVTVTPAVDGINVDMTITPDINGVPGAPVSVIAGAFVPGGQTIDYRVQIGGRTGGSDLDLDLDNIATTVGTLPQSPFTKQTFEFNQIGTGYKAHAFGAGSPPEVVVVGDLQPTAALRLIHDGQNSSNNRVAFDQTADGELLGDQLVIADFDFRIESAAAMMGADGFSLRFVPVSEFGTTGEGPAGSAEEPNIADVLAIGFDIHPADGGTNDVSIHWTGTEIQNTTLDPQDLDLDDAEWHHARVIWQPSGGGGSTVTLVLDETLVVAQDLPIVDLDLYPYRLQFAGRSGGRNMTIDLDNIFAAASDVLNEDTDGDMLPNVWEEEHGLDPLVSTGEDGKDGDPDMDESSNLEEFMRETDPRDNDSDDDGAIDGHERGDPMDGFVSATETGTDPLNPDTDGDGLLDGVENPLQDYDPEDPFNQPGTDPHKGDTDMDSFSDLAELRAGTDPTDPNDKPELASTVVLKEDFDVFSFNSTFAFTNTGGMAPVVMENEDAQFNAARLTHATNNNNNAIAWDFVGYAAPQVNISFLYRMSEDGNPIAADGFGFGLYDTGVYGTSGPANPGTAGAVWEDPRNVPGHPNALFIGFDVHDSGDGQGNEIRLSGIGGSTDVFYNMPAPYQLNNGLYNQVTLSLTSDGNGGADLDVAIVEDVHGAAVAHAILTGQNVPGIDPLTFEGRLIAGGRTGGRNVETDIDCVQIEALPFGGDFRITNVVYDEILGTIELTWNSLPGVSSYSIWASTDLEVWDEEVSGIPATKGTTTGEVQNVQPDLIPEWFFRIQPTQP